MIWRHFTLTSLLSFTQKKTQHKEFLWLWFPNYSLSMQLLFFYLFWFWLLSIWRIRLFHIFARILLPLHHSWTLHVYFHFKKSKPLSIFTRKSNVRWKRKTKQMYDKPKHQNPPYNLKCKYLLKDLQIIKKISKCFCKRMQIEDEYASFNVGLLWNFFKINEIHIKQ
jgi:hypothetical protein